MQCTIMTVYMYIHVIKDKFGSSFGCNWMTQLQKVTVSFPGINTHATLMDSTRTCAQAVINWIINFQDIQKPQLTCIHLHTL